MGNPDGFDFTKFVPGFDFLKNLTPGANASAAAPGWVAPTLDPEELDKRIQELKTVHFWLEQNAKAVGATIQALEVQRMTLATLKGMNMSFQDLAESLKVKPQADAKPEPTYSFMHSQTVAAPTAEPAPSADHETRSQAKPKKTAKASAQHAAGVDPAHWWGALTDQFQHIATHAMHDMAHRATAHAQAPAGAASSKSAKPAAKKTATPRKRSTPSTKTTASKPKR
jgi:cell division septation protein DedD